jgi:PAS domain-containing protein
MTGSAATHETSRPYCHAGVEKSPRRGFCRSTPHLTAGRQDGFQYNDETCPLKTVRQFQPICRAPALATTYSLEAEIAAGKRGEEALQERARLLDLTHDTVFVRDLRDVITFWNRGAETLYEWTREEALGRVSHERTRMIFPAPVRKIDNSDVADFPISRRNDCDEERATSNRHLSKCRP